MKLICKECLKEVEKDEKKSNKNWNVYKPGPCKFCGGKTVPDILINKDKK